MKELSPEIIKAASNMRAVKLAGAIINRRVGFLLKFMGKRILWLFYAFVLLSLALDTTGFERWVFSIIWSAFVVIGVGNEWGLLRDTGVVLLSTEEVLEYAMGQLQELNDHLPEEHKEVIEEDFEKLKAKLETWRAEQKAKKGKKDE